MQTCKHFLLAIAATLAFATSAFAADVLKMGTEAGHPPFNDKDASGAVVGFDVDIGNALCAKMKIECAVVTADWNSLISELNDDKFNFLISSMSVTDDRKQAVDFTDPYYSNKLQFVGSKTKDVTINKDALKESLQGKTVGAQRGTLAAAWLTANLEGDSVVIDLFDTQDDGYLALSSGTLDAVLADKFVSYEWLKSDAGKGFEFKGEPVLDHDKVAIAVRKGDPLREQLNAALKGIIEDGTYKKINDRYFPFSIL